MLLPNRNDVLCGRGMTITSHVGNKNFRSLVNESRDRFCSTKVRKEKRGIALKIISDIQGLDPPGRFLIGEELPIEEGEADGELPQKTAAHQQGVNPALLRMKWQLADHDKALHKTLHCLREKPKIPGSVAERRKRAREETTAFLLRKPRDEKVPGTAPVSSPQQQQNDEAERRMLGVCLNQAMESMQQQVFQRYMLQRHMMLQQQSAMVAAMMMNGSGKQLPAIPITAGAMTGAIMPPLPTDEPSKPCVSGSENGDAASRPAGRTASVFNSLDEDSLHTLLRFRRSWQVDDDDDRGGKGGAKRSGKR
mmetsp:Transcript_33012/g.78830  ORF Transcript_33012/g.78830 Transcript_33012/m.78830 type:complete len:308 (-) Transcript_33012:533-1456(-)